MIKHAPHALDVDIAFDIAKQIYDVGQKHDCAGCVQAMLANVVVCAISRSFHRNDWRSSVKELAKDIVEMLSELEKLDIAREAREARDAKEEGYTLQ